MQRLLELINSVKLQDIKSIYKDQLYFYILATSSQKKKGTGGEVPAEKALVTHSSTLAWKIPWAEEPRRLQSRGSLRVRHDWAISLSLFTFMHWRRKWQPTPVFLPGESQGWEPRGLPSMGLHRVGHDWSDLAAAAAVSWRIWKWHHLLLLILIH